MLSPTRLSPAGVRAVALVHRRPVFGAPGARIGHSPEAEAGARLRSSGTET